MSLSNRRVSFASFASFASFPAVAAAALAVSVSACSVEAMPDAAQAPEENVASTSSELGGLRCDANFECKNVGGEKVGVKAKVGPVKTGAKVKVFAGPNKRDDVNLTLVNHYYKGGTFQCCAVKQSHGKRTTKLMDGRIDIDWRKLANVIVPVKNCIVAVVEGIKGGDSDSETFAEVVGEIVSSCSVLPELIKEAVSVKDSEYTGVRSVVRVENDGETKEWFDATGKVANDGRTSTYCPVEQTCGSED